VVGIPNAELSNLASSPAHADKLIGAMEMHKELISLVCICICMNVCVCVCIYIYTVSDHPLSNTC
jgi:hypothetical protein